MVEMMDKQPKNEQALKKHNLVFHPIEESLAIKSLKNDYKGVVKQSVIQNLPLIMSEFMKELLKQNSTKLNKK
jgi:hypothetical protein